MMAIQEITPDDRTECGLLRWKDDDQVEKTFHLREGDTVQMGRVPDNNVCLEQLACLPASRSAGLAG